VASQAFNQFDIELPQPFMLRDILPGPGWAPYQPPPQVVIARINRPSKKNVAEGSCAKGLLVAIAFESTVALGALGIWQLWHFIR